VAAMQVKNRLQNACEIAHVNEPLFKVSSSYPANGTADKVLIDEEIVNIFISPHEILNGTT
jgi:hypothetical protein